LLFAFCFMSRGAVGQLSELLETYLCTWISLSIDLAAPLTLKKDEC
jgi:hypothetical protein